MTIHTMISAAYWTRLVTPHTGRLEACEWREIRNLLWGACSIGVLTSQVGVKSPIYPESKRSRGIMLEECVGGGSLRLESSTSNPRGWEIRASGWLEDTPGSRPDG